MEEHLAPKYLRIARASFLYTVIVVTVCTSGFLLPVSKEILFFIFCIYGYIFYIIVTVSSLYVGFRLTGKHCKYFREFLAACFIHTVLSTLALICTLYLIFFLMDLMNAGDGSGIFATVTSFAFSDYKFAVVSPVSFFLGGGYYWLEKMSNS